MQDAKYSELRKEDQFVGMNPDADGKPQHYHVWFTAENIKDLANGKCISFKSDTNLRLRVVYEYEEESEAFVTLSKFVPQKILRRMIPDKSKIEAIEYADRISMVIFSSDKTESGLAKLINDSPCIPISYSESKLSFMPHYVPGIADYRMQTV